MHAVEDVSLDIARGSITGLVGESGSGKTTFGRALLRLIEPTSGSVRFDGVELTTLGAPEMLALRRRMQIIFQDPVSSLNPRMKVGAIIAEGLVAHGIGTRADRRDRVAALLEEVGLPPDAWAATRTSSPAASGSGSASPGRWRSSPSSSSPTRASRRSTCRSRRRS